MTHCDIAMHLLSVLHRQMRPECLQCALQNSQPLTKDRNFYGGVLYMGSESSLTITVLDAGFLCPVLDYTLWACKIEWAIVGIIVCCLVLPCLSVTHPSLYSTLLHIVCGHYNHTIGISNLHYKLMEVNCKCCACTVCCVVILWLANVRQQDCITILSCWSNCFNDIDA